MTRQELLDTEGDFTKVYFDKYFIKTDKGNFVYTVYRGEPGLLRPSDESFDEWKGVRWGFSLVDMGRFMIEDFCGSNVSVPYL